MLRYLSRYAHRVAISNWRLVSADDKNVSFGWKDYRIDGPDRWKTMTLAAHEFIRRFLMHILPRGFHRIRHYGLFANTNRVANIARARELLLMPTPTTQPEHEQPAQPGEPQLHPCPCPCCGARMLIIETFERGCEPKCQPIVLFADAQADPGVATYHRPLARNRDPRARDAAQVKLQPIPQNVWLQVRAPMIGPYAPLHGSK